MKTAIRTGRELSLKSAAVLLCFCGSALAQSIAITSPTAAQIVSGFSIPLTAALTSLPTVASVEYLVDGESQGILWSAPWSIPSWNTNNRYNGPAHTVWAIARNALGVTIATSPVITFGISNNYLEPPAYISLTSVTPSTPITSNWSGVVSLTAVFGGTNATNKKQAQVFVDGDYFGFNSLLESNQGSTATTMFINVNTSQYPDGAHEVCLDFRDLNGTAPTSGGFPFGEWCQAVNFANTSTILLVNAIAASDVTGTHFATFNAPKTGSATLTAGHFVLACATGFSPGAITMTDTAGNTYTALASATSNNWKEQCFYAANVTGSASNVYTAHMSSSPQDISLLVREYSGVATTSPIDVNASSSGTAAAQCPCILTSSAFTTTAANEMIDVLALPEINGVVFKPGFNTTLDIVSADGNGGGDSQLVSSVQTGATASIGTLNANGLAWLMLVVSFKAQSSTAVSTPSQVTLSPKEWVIPPAGTVQLTPVIANTNMTTTAPTGMNQAYSTANSSVCTVSGNGLVTGVAFGWCAVTVTLGNGLTETINGWVSSTNLIPYFGTDGQIHTSGGTPLWFASVFQSTSPAGFGDPNKPQTQFGNAYNLAGFNVLEGGLTQSATWGTSCSNFQSTLNTYIASQSSLLNQFGLFFHGSATGLITGSNPSQFYVGVRGLGATCTPQSWQYLSQQWTATGRFMGITLADETDADYSYPVPTPVISASGPFTGITCTTSTTPTCTGSYSSPPTDTSGVRMFAIFGATTNSVLNSTIGNAATLYSFTAINPSTFTFTGPSGASGITVTPASDPTIRIEPFAYEWENNNTDYQHYQDFSTLSSLVHTGGGTIAGSPRAIAGATAQCGWGGICGNWSDFAEIYNQPVNTFGPSQYVPLSTIRQGSLNIYYNDRNFMNNAGALRAFLGQTTGTPNDYGLNGQTISGISCVGAVCTFPAPHGIYNVIPYVSRVAFSGSSNSYYNNDFFIDSCPTATTCTISLVNLSVSAAKSTGGVVTFAGGNVMNGACLSATPNAILQSETNGNCANLNTAQQGNNNQTFTVSGAAGANASYWDSTTFILSGAPIPQNVLNPTGPIRELPAATQVSGPMTGVLVANDNYVRGQSQNVLGEIVNGPRTPFASVMANAIMGASGHRFYQLGTDYAMQSAAGTTSQRGFGQLNCNNASSLNCIQAGANPFYEQGADLVRAFESPTNANLLLERLATTGYLYAPRGNTPDIAFNIESSLRQGPNGNLLLTASYQDGPQTHPVDLTGCNVANQKKIRYVLDWRSMLVTELPIGTLSDTPTWPAGGAVIYLCPNNEALEYSAPTVSVKLADIPNAASVVIQFANAPYFLNQATGNVVSCSTGTCTVPVDRKIGPWYYRLLYLDTNGDLLASSDVQAL